MPHIVIDLDFSTHPKIVKLDPLSQLLFLRSLQYAGKHLTDGFIPKEAIPLLTYDFIPYLRITATILAKQKHNLDNLDHNLDNPDHNLDHNLADLAGVLIDQLTRKIGDKNNLWITQEDGWVIHDYLDWQWSKRQVEEFKERRAETSRKNGHLGGPDPASAGARPTVWPGISFGRPASSIRRPSCRRGSPGWLPRKPTSTQRGRRR